MILKGEEYTRCRQFRRRKTSKSYKSIAHPRSTQGSMYLREFIKCRSWLSNKRNRINATAMSVKKPCWIHTASNMRCEILKKPSPALHWSLLLLLQVGKLTSWSWEMERMSISCVWVRRDFCYALWGLLRKWRPLGPSDNRSRLT